MTSIQGMLNNPASQAYVGYQVLVSFQERVDVVDERAA